MPSFNSLRAAAIFEATKGALVLLAGFGVLSLIHHDLQQFAGQLVGHLHLNPAKRYPQIFLDAIAHLTVPRLWLLAGLAVCYTAARFVEAYGLWRDRRWAEWFAAVSGGIYIPFELYALLHGIDLLAIGALLANLLIVAVALNALRRKRRVAS